MSRFRSLFLSLVLVICVVFSRSVWAGDPASLGRVPLASVPHSLVAPLSFEPNQGQVDQRVDYLARGQGYTLFLTSGAAVLGLRSGDPANPTQWLRIALKGAASHPATTGEEELSGKAHYFIGNNPAKWRTNVPTFSRVRYRQVYPGVDLVYYGREGKLENDFEVAPRANPEEICWRLEGAEAMHVDSTGDLIVTVGGREVRLQRPRAYQHEGEQQREIPVRFRVYGQEVSFALGEYNRQQKLIIDPVLIYSTYLGGSGGDTAYGVAIDSAGDTYVLGVTASTNFPTTPASQNFNATGGGTNDYGLTGSANVFVTKFNPSGTSVDFSTYLGGSGVDTPAQIVLNSSGDIFLVGSTTSNNYPTFGAVFQSQYGGIQDAFLTEMNSSGSALIYSTYIGGTGMDYGTALTLDASGDAYVTGSTNSTDFPTLNPIQLSNDGLYDAYVTEVSPTGALIYSTYLGGSESDYGTGIGVDSSGNVYVSGYTFSTNFPTQSALQSSLSGGSDVFVTKFVPGATALLFSTYLGGSSNDMSMAMTMDSDNNIYLTGGTESSNFPVTSSAYQASLQGTQNTFLTKLNSTGTVVVFSTYLGGGGTDQANAIALDSTGNIYITGFTQSTNFPLLNSFQNTLGLAGAATCGSTNLINLPTNSICADAFVVEFGPSGTPVYSSYLGGSGSDTGQGIAVNSAGTVYVVGGTTSPNFPVTAGSTPASTSGNLATVSAFQWNYLGSEVFSNAFLTEIVPQDFPSVSLTPQKINFGNQPLQSPSTSVTVTLTNEGSAALSIASITVSGDLTQTNSCGTSVAGGGGTCSIQITFTPTSVGTQTDQLIITDNANQAGNTVTQTVTITGNGVLTGGSLLFSPTKLTFPAQTVGVTSTPLPAVLTNNGNQPVTLTNITATSGFSETNNCGPDFPTVSASLNVDQSCTVNVSFTPTSTGSVSGSIAVTSTAVSGTSSLTLSGTGTSVFSLSSNARSSVLLIGTKTTTFAISVAGPSTFQSSVALSCSSGATCTFSPSSISVGQSSTLTVTGLSATSANPLDFTVTGTSGTQSATVSLAIFFADFSIAATPSGTTVTAGTNATYTITATGTNSFNQVVLLSCGSIPQDTVCYWTPPSLPMPGTTTNNTMTSTLTITTIAESTRLLRPPPGNMPPRWGRWLLVMALLTFLAGMLTGFGRFRQDLRPRLRAKILLVAISLAALGVACNDYYVNPISITQNISGTPAGTTSIVLTGTLGTDTSVTRATTVNLSVLPSS